MFGPTLSNHTMKKIQSFFSILLLITTLTLLTGCVAQSVPMTRITGTIDGQPFTLNTPKDSKLTGLEITAQSGGLTNYCRIRVDALEAHMNPDVITTTGDAQAKLIKATGDATLQAIQAGGAMAGAAVKGGL